MAHNERFDQLESLMANMLRHMDRLEASQERNNNILDSVVDVLKIVDQRFQRVEDALLKSEERQDATLRLLLQQSDNLTAAFRTLESHDGRIQKLEGTPPAPSMRPVR